MEMKAHASALSMRWLVTFRLDLIFCRAVRAALELR